MPLVMETCTLHQRARLRPHHRPGHTRRDPGRSRRCRRAYLGVEPRRDAVETAASTTPTPPILELAVGPRRLRPHRRAARRRPRRSSRARCSRCSARTARASRRRSPSRRARSCRAPGACSSAAATSPASPPDALARAGVCLIPEGRGIFPNLTVAENLRMATYTGTSFRDVLDRAFAQFPRLGNGASRRRARCRAASSRCSPWPGRSRPSPPCCSSTSCRWGWRRIIVDELYDHVRRIAASGLSILDRRAVRARDPRRRRPGGDHAARPHRARPGTPSVIADELAGAYLGAEHS